jgi:hypothetical protein
VEGSCEHGNEPTGSIKCWEVLGLSWSPVIWKLTSVWRPTGGSDDWAKGAAGIKYSYTIELRDRGAYGFILPARYIIPTAREALAAVKTLAMEAANVR